MKINYFKVVGQGLGRAAHCFPFSAFEEDRERAYARALEAAAKERKARVVAYLATFKTPHVVGVATERAS